VLRLFIEIADETRGLLDAAALVLLLLDCHIDSAELTALFQSAVYQTEPKRRVFLLTQNRIILVGFVLLYATFLLYL
jgi:hypothetical protein